MLHQATAIRTYIANTQVKNHTRFRGFARGFGATIGAGSMLHQRNNNRTRSPISSDPTAEPVTRPLIPHMVPLDVAIDLNVPVEPWLERESALTAFASGIGSPPSRFRGRYHIPDGIGHGADVF